MNNKIIIGVIVALVVVGGGLYLVSNNKDAGVVGTNTMNQLLASTDAIECVYTQSDDFNEVTGTIYVADGKVRGDFTTKTKSEPVQSFESHLITDGKQVFLWPLAPDTPNQGVVMSVEVRDQVNLDQPFDTICKPWNKKDSKLSTPDDVQFEDFAVIQQALQAQAQAAGQEAAMEAETENEAMEEETPAE